MTTYEGISIRRVSTASQVAEALTELILRGEIKAGAHLRENALVSSLGVSRNTIREAVRLLEQGGLVHHEFNFGAVVIEPSIDDLTDLYNARLHIEGAAARVKATSEQIATVRSAYDALSIKAQDGHAREIALKDLDFHAAIAGLLGSKRIDAFFAQIKVELRFYLQVLAFEDHEYDHPNVLIREHGTIMDAIEAGDSVRTVKAVTDHIQANSRRLTEILMIRNSDKATHTQN
ncbi:unannotated protein [freshwater metagenome]|uniref:Unannotated protein n=1 Tax=freshwater metagenome TaxID=449393 RepID=A0A6J6YAJ7_9ZZZZ|nr:FCD domain-containing protein [Actinomycetota bacterium]